MNAIRNRHLSVQLGENTKIDLGILNYLTQMNKSQLDVKVDSTHTPTQIHIQQDLCVNFTF